MNPARAPRASPLSERLLHIDPSGSFSSRSIVELPDLFGPGDVLVVNDAATLPASFRLRDRDAELRLVGTAEHDRWRAVLFGAGDWRTPTERRPAAPTVHVGERLDLGDELTATVTAIDAQSPRLIDVRFSLAGARLWQAIYRLGRPIQYAYLEAPLALWDVQNVFAARPWAFELPSAGRPLNFELLLGLRKRGVQLASLTHAAGISSTGSNELDARLPLPERYEIPEASVAKIAAAGRVVAAGTTIVRALEANFAEHGELRPGFGQAKLVIGPGFVPKVTHGILTGMHEQGTSHFALLEAFAPRELLGRALEHAAELGYLEHEFGDACLIVGCRRSKEPSESASFPKRGHIHYAAFLTRLEQAL